MRRPSRFRAWVPPRFALLGSVVLVSLLLAFPRASWADDSLQNIRDNVRDPPPAGSSGPSVNLSDANNNTNVNSGSGNLEDISALDLLVGIPVAFAAPIIGPMTLLDDDLFRPGYFPRAPYEDSPGYVTRDDGPEFRPWSMRVDAEYANDFGGIQSVGGHFLLDTTYRFGFEASGSELVERFAGARYDNLALGDANLVFRFAQCPWGEFRTGLGANWLADRQATNYGFNFTYAADFFPGNPWVISSVIDAGTLGYAGLFRFRLTGGAVFHGVEAYAGYEFLDIGRTPTNSLVTGLRFWF